MKARLAGAAALALIVLALLAAGGTPVPPALMFGLAFGCFTAWRTLAGAGAGFALMLASAVLVVLPEPLFHETVRTIPVLVLLTIEIYGLGTALLVRSGEHRPSRRLLGAWLASSGTLVLGLAHLDLAPGIASMLVCGALAYRMGAFPAFGWAPLLLRHPSNNVAWLGVIAFIATGVATILLVSVLPDAHATRWSLRILGAVAVPFTLWHTRRQWSIDRRCARSYLAALASALLLLLVSFTA